MNFEIKTKLANLMKYVQIFNTFGTSYGVRCLVSKIAIRSRIDQFKGTYFNQSNHIVTYIILHSTASKEICKFVKINAKSNSCTQTNILG